MEIKITAEHWNELEIKRAIEASKKTISERFHILMSLIKVSYMLKNAKIISSPTPNK